MGLILMCGDVWRDVFIRLNERLQQQEVSKHQWESKPSIWICVLYYYVMQLYGFIGWSKVDASYGWTYISGPSTWLFSEAPNSDQHIWQSVYLCLILVCPLMPIGTSDIYQSGPCKQNRFPGPHKQKYPLTSKIGPSGP